jgi:hypothetical protein
MVTEKKAKLYLQDLDVSNWNDLSLYMISRVSKCDVSF